MKILSKIIGSVQPETLCRSGGNLLFACGGDVIITGGADNEQILFHSFSARVKKSFSKQKYMACVKST